MKRFGRSGNIDMLSGSLWDRMLIFAIPLALTSLLQQLFNSADVAVVGRFAGSEALAAVGSNAPVINLLVNLFVGLSIGTNVVIARRIGAGDDRGVKRAVHTSVLLALVSGVLLAVVGLVFANPILRMMQTPENVIRQSAAYLKIYFAGMPFIMVYNFSTAILRSRGDTQRPLMILAASGVINVALNLFLVAVCGMGVEGVAIATVISNAFSACVLIVLLCRESGALRLDLRELRISADDFRQIAKVGVPAGVQGIMFSISNVIIQSEMNRFGSTVMAASAAALNFEFYAYYILSAFAQTATTFIGQNYGAGNIARARRAMRTGLAETLIITSIFSWAMILFKVPLAGLFSRDPEVIRLCGVRMTVVMTLEFLNASIEYISYSIRGFGDSLTPAIVCMVSICGVRLAYIFTLFRRFGTYEALVAIYPVSWMICVAGLCVVYVRRVRGLQR